MRLRAWQVDSPPIPSENPSLLAEPQTVPELSPPTTVESGQSFGRPSHVRTAPAGQEYLPELSLLLTPFRAAQFERITMSVHRLAVRHLVVTLCTLASLAGAAQAQQPMPVPGGEAPGQQLPDSLQEMLQEAQATQERLQGLQEQALAENEALQEQQAELREMVDAAMREAEPRFDDHIQRMEELEQEALAAQQSQDGERLQDLMAEAQSLSMTLQAAQSRAMQAPGVQEEIEAHQESLLEEMTRLDPETPQLIERLAELGETLRAAGIG